MKIQSTPYLCPSPNRILVNSWHVSLAELEAEQFSLLEPVQPVFSEWDPAAPVWVSIYAVLEVAAILKECELPSTATLRFALLWLSEGTTLRGCAAHVDLNVAMPSVSVHLQACIEGENLLDSVDLVPTLVLAARPNYGNRLAPKLEGTILWSRSRRVVLGTSGMRFPIELQDFSSNRSVFPEGAAWLLDWDRDSFERPVHGGLRLYVNSTHPVIMRAVASSGTESTADDRIREIIRYDVARSLISAALESELFQERFGSHPPGSIGDHIETLIATLFPHESLGSLRTAWTLNRWRFDSMLQHALRLFHEEPT